MTTASEIASEIAAEQAHVNRVYVEVANAARRSGQVAAEGLARGRTERTGTAREEEITGLFERDALVFHAARRQQALDSQYEGLVFGRLDLQAPAQPGNPQETQDDSDTTREVRYVGRLGIRDADYEPLVIDWRAPAAAPFYRATPVEPLGVLRRRVLRCRGETVVDIEDDLMVPEPPEGLVVVGDGALMAALARSRGDHMRDIVATIQRHQDEAIRAPGAGVTEISGGPGTGKTVVALHRAAYLLYADRRRFERGGILVIGPSAAYTAYIERVLPSLGEDSVALRALGDVVDAISTERHDQPAAAALKGSLGIRAVLARAARDQVPGAPRELRVFVGGYAVRLDAPTVESIREQMVRQHPRNLGADAARQALAQAAWRSVRHPERDDFVRRFLDHAEVEAFMQSWWPQLDPREVLLWLADPDRLHRYAAGLLSAEQIAVLCDSMQVPLATGTWSISDVPLVDDLAARLGPVQEAPPDEQGFYQIEQLDALLDEAAVPARHGSSTLTAGSGAAEPTSYVRPTDARDRLLSGRLGPPGSYAHVLVDEAQDLSPMQWRMVGRRGRSASWTVVGDAAQSCWPDPSESEQAKAAAFGSQDRRLFHLATNYRNAQEIFDYAAEWIRRHVLDADIPEAVRESGVAPVVRPLGADMPGSVLDALDELAGQVDGSIAVIAPDRYLGQLGDLVGRHDRLRPRVRVVDPLSAKGLEWDAVVVVAPQTIVDEATGGARTLYVALTRAAHRLAVLS